MTVPSSSFISELKRRKASIQHDGGVFSVLSKTGAEVIWAKDGDECVSLFKENPDTAVILMDMQMPVKDGYAAAREILKIDPKVPIVAQTAYSMDDERERILNTGCVGYVAKPIDRFELLKKIDSVIR